MSEKKVIQGKTSPLETFAGALLAQNIEELQQQFRLDSVNFAAVIGMTIGEMLAQADHGSEQRMQLPEEQLEPLKRTMLLNFDVAYNRVRSEMNEPAKPKKGVL